MDILELLQEHNIEYHTEGHEHCRSGWVQIDCPFCEKDAKRFHFGIPLTNAIVGNCWRCGVHSILTALVECTQLSYPELKKQLDEIQVVGIQQTHKKRGELKLPPCIDELQTQHISYLKRRGFHNVKELEQLWRIKGIGIGTKINWCIFIPILFNGDTVSWTTRSLSDKGKRYLHASIEEEAIRKSELLYGEDYARHTIIICEGPLDVWKIGPGAVATMGLSYTKEQVLRMLRYPIRAVCFDNEDIAQKRAEELTDLLSIYPGETYNIRLDSNDAGSATEKELKKIRKLLK